MNNPIKQALLDILDFLKYKVETDGCTPEEMKSAYKAVAENVCTKATTSDIADFYDQSPSNVRNLVSRWGVHGESKRYYDFGKLQRFIPKSWRKRKRNTEPKPNVIPYMDAPCLLAAEEDTTYGNVEQS